MARLPQGCLSSEGTAQGHERVADVWEEWGSLLGLGGGCGLSPIILVGPRRVRESNTRKNAHRVCRLPNHPGKCLSSIHPSYHCPHGEPRAVGQGPGTEHGVAKRRSALCGPGWYGSPRIMVPLARSTQRAAPANSVPGPCGPTVDLSGRLSRDQDKPAPGTQEVALLG